MAFAAVASGTSTRGLFGDTSIVLSKPAAAAVGHLAVVVFHQESDSPGVTVTGPSGWTLFGESFNANSAPDSRQRLYYKILDAGDIAASNFTWSWSGTIYGGGCLSLFSADGTITLGTLGAFNNTNNNTATTVIPAVTTDQDGALVIGSNDDWQERTVTWPSPMTETVDINGCAIAYNVQATAGTTGTVTITHDAGGAQNNARLSTFNEAPVAGAAHLAPDGDITVNTWTDDAGGTTNLYQRIDEATASDTDYVQSVANPASIIYECTLENGTDPGLSSSHIARVRARVDALSGGAVTLRTEVRQGASALSTPAFWDDVLTATAQTFEHTLSAAQTDAITDYTDLRYRFTATQAAPSAPTLVAAGTAAYTATSGASISPGLPSGWAANDIHILVAATGNNTTFVVPAGWTQLSGTNSTTAFRCEVWWRRAVGGDTAPSLTLSTNAVTIVRGARIYGVRGCPTSGSPFDTSTGAPTALANAASATVSFTNLTTIGANRFILAVGAYEDDPTGVTTITNYTEPANSVAGSTLGNDMMQFYEYRELASAGSAGSGGVTVSGGTFANSPSVGVLMALIPDPSNSRARVTWAELEVPELLTGYPAEVMADTPLGYWRLGEASGSVAADLSGNGRQGTYFGGVTYGVTGAVETSTDTAVTLDGTSGYASVPSTGLTLGSGPGTMECWASITSGYSGNPRMLAFGANLAWEIFLDGANRHLCIFNFNGGVTDTGFTFAFDTLYHVVLTVDASNIIVYIDGAVVFNPAFSAAASNSGMALYIGQSGNAADWWKGTIDEVAIYDTALSPTRVTAHYDASQLPTGVTVSPSPVSAAASVVNPTVAQASLSLTPAPVAAAAARLGPTVLAASITTPTPASVVAARVNPTVVAASITATPSPASAVAAVVAPTISITGGVVSLPYADDFTGSPNGAATIVDTTSEISVVNNRLYVEGDGPATWTDVRYSHGPFDRAALGGFSALVRVTNYSQTNGGFRVVLSPSATDPADADAVGFHTDNQGSGNYQLFAAGDRINVPTTHSIDYLYSIVAREDGGFFCLVSGGEYGTFPAATLVNVTDSEVDATIWLHLASRQARFHADFVRVFGTADLPTALTTRFGPALAADTYDRGSLGTTTEVGAKTYVTSGTVGITSNELSVANGAYVVFDAGARGRWIELTITSASSNFAVYFRNSGTTINSGPAGTGYSAFFDTAASGIWDEAGGGPADQRGDLLWPGGTHKVRIHDRGSVVQTFLDDQLVATVNSPSYGAQYGVGIFNYSGGTITVNDFAVWPETLTLNSNFGPVPEVPAGNGSATFSETFPGADGASLPVAWTAQSGTWEQRSGHGQMTAAAVSGIATVETGLTDHEVKARIYHPAAPPTYPPDWFTGLMLRFTDTSNFIQAHALYQNTGAPSNEIEVRETVAGVATLINYVNLGNLYTPGGSNVLRAAVNGSEVAVYVDDALVVQTTTSITTGTEAGMGVNDATPYGQPAWDEVEVRTTGLAPLVISPSAVAAGTALNGPVVIQATLTLTPTAAASPTSVLAPVAVQASLSLNGGVAASTASLVNPTVLQATLTLSVTGAIARALGLDPAIIAGGGIAAGIVSGAASVVAPSVVQASLSLAGGNVSSAAAVVSPAVSISTNPITPAPAAAATSTTGALVVGGPVAVSPSPAVSSAQSVAPVIVQTSLTLAGGAVVSRALSVNPAVLAQMLYTPSPVVGATSRVNPVAVQASIVLSAQVAAAASVVAPTIIQTSVIYAPVFADTRTQLAGPLVSVGALFVNAGIASGATSVVAPTVQRGAIVYTPVAVTAGAHALAGQVVYSALTLSAAPAVARSSTLTGFAGAGSLTVIPLALSASAATFGGAVVYGSILLSPLPVVGAVGVSPVVVVYGAIVITPPAVEAGTETLSPRIVFFNAGEMTVTERTGGLLVVEQRGPSMGITERDPDMHIEYRP